MPVPITRDAKQVDYKILKSIEIWLSGKNATGSTSKEAVSKRPTWNPETAGNRIEFTQLRKPAAGLRAD
jgi:hypothetical protein